MPIIPIVFPFFNRNGVFFVSDLLFISVFYKNHNFSKQKIPLHRFGAGVFCIYWGLRNH